MRKKIILGLLVFTLAFTALLSVSPAGAPPTRVGKYAIFVRGHFDTGNLVPTLRSSAIYTSVLDWGYNSYWVPLEAHSVDLAAYITANVPAGVWIDLYGFSYGGIVARYFVKHNWDSVRNPIEFVFTMGTPNQGIFIDVSDVTGLLFLNPFEAEFIGAGFAGVAMVRPMAPIVPPLIYRELPGVIYPSIQAVFYRNLYSNAAWLGTAADHTDHIRWYSISGYGFGGVYIIGNSMRLSSPNNGILGDGMVPTERCNLDGATNIRLNVDHVGTQDWNTIFPIISPPIPEESSFFSDIAFFFALASVVAIVSVIGYRKIRVFSGLAR
jgi:pimeloyl-ACP methyl ester carboxylesterase